MPQLAGMSDDVLKDMLKPDDSGFRAEIYLPDPAALGPGYQPTVVFKGSRGAVREVDGGLRDTSAEDFGANNLPQSIGQKTDYYDRAMELATTFQKLGIRVHYAGHSLGGGMVSAAVAVSGERGTTFNSAGLHPETARRFARENPGVEVFDPNPRITAWQIRGEVLNDGLQNNIERMDVAQRRVLGHVLEDVSALMQDVPQLKQAMTRQLASAHMPNHAREAITGFVDALAEGDTDRLLRDLPLAAGQVRVLDPKTLVDGRVVDRPAAMPLDEVTALAGPALRAAASVTDGARLGRAAGGLVQGAGQVVDRALDAGGDALRAQGDRAADGFAAAAGAAQWVSCETGEALTGSAAQARIAAGVVEAKLEGLAADAQTTARTAQGVFWQGVAGMAPDGSPLDQWANQQVDQAIEDTRRTGQDVAARQLDTAQDAARDAAAIRAAGADACSVMETVEVVAQRTQHAAVTSTSYAADVALDAAGQRVARAADVAPVVGAVMGGMTAAQLRLNPFILANAPTLAELSRTTPGLAGSGPAAGEAVERHSMTSTVLPSMQVTTDAMGTQARQWLEAHPRTPQPQPRLDPQPDPPAPGQTPQRATPAAALPPDFAPSLTRGPDLREPENPGHAAFRELRHRVAMHETRQGIPNGDHTERVAAALLQFAVENKVHYQSVYFEKDPQTGLTQLLERPAPFRSEGRRFDVDLGKLSAQPIEASSQGTNTAVSRHYVGPERAQVQERAQERTQEQAQALAGLSPADRTMFARIRVDTPGHVSDAHVMQAMVAAKDSGMGNLSGIGRVMMFGDSVRVTAAGEAGKSVMVDVTQPAPPLQASVDTAKVFDQQQTLLLAQQQNAPAQDEPGRGMRMA